MEQQNRTQLTTITTFVLEQSEIKKLYTNLALFQYSYFRVPNYSEQVLLRKLEEDFRKYLLEMQAQVERDPNNYMLRQINAFVDIHYRQIRKLMANNDK